MREAEHRPGPYVVLLSWSHLPGATVLAAPGSLETRTAFTGSLRLLTAEEGGRRTPVVSGYRPQLYSRTTDIVADITLVGQAKATPGDTVEVTVELGKPVPLEVGQTFALREGGRTVAAGTVTG